MRAARSDAQREIRAARRELADADIEWEAALTELREEGTEAVRATVLEFREQQVAALAARDAAAEEALHLHQRVAELEDSLDVVRSARVNGLLEKVSKQ